MFPLYVIGFVAARIYLALCFSFFFGPFFLSFFTLFFLFLSCVMSTTTQTVESIQLKHRNVTQRSFHAEEHELTLNDPLSLKDQKTADDYIQVQLKGKKKLQNFYQNQNDMIDNMLTALDEGDDDEEQKQLLKVKYIITVKRFCYFIYPSILVENSHLWIGRCEYFTVCFTVSSCRDLWVTIYFFYHDRCLYGLAKLCCTVMGFETSIEIERNKVPRRKLTIHSVLLFVLTNPPIVQTIQGKSRMETVGIIVFSCLMSCVALFLIVNNFFCLFFKRVYYI